MRNFCKIRNTFCDNAQNANSVTSESAVLLSVQSVASLLPHWVELPILFDVLFASLLQSSHSREEKKKLSKHVNHDQYEINVVKNSKPTRVLSVSNAAREPLPKRSSASSFSSSSSSSSSFYGEKVIIRNLGFYFLVNILYLLHCTQNSYNIHLSSSYL